ncbi:MAG TPA: fibronectin type III domain-containing protein, partial [Solirubrobacteraceae bacterium]|nr:fibronectin type III domain-containing protein [Solirubrobacteraceae bacterium]
EHTSKAVSLPSDGAEHQVSATVTGLTPGSGYHFRLVAKNKLGSVQGNDLTFMAASTLPAKEPTKEPPAKEPSSAPSSTGGNPTATTSSSPSSGQPKVEPASGPLFGSVKLASTQHGGVVHGSLVVSSAGSEGQLQIELFTKGAATPVGKLVRSSPHAGKLTFALPLNAKDKAALHRHRRLTLMVKITLTPVHGAAVTVTRVVVVHA